MTPRLLRLVFSLGGGEQGDDLRIFGDGRLETGAGAVMAEAGRQRIAQDHSCTARARLVKDALEAKSRMARVA